MVNHGLYCDRCRSAYAPNYGKRMGELCGHAGCQGLVWPRIRPAQIEKETTMIGFPSERLKLAFYKNAGDMGIETRHTDVNEFVRDVAATLARFIDDRLYDSDWEFQLSAWLPQVIEIACRLKGYKADVMVEQVIRAGSPGFAEEMRIRPLADEAVSGNGHGVTEP